MSAVCVYGDGPVAASVARARLLAGDEVALLCRNADRFALLVNEFQDSFLPIEIGNPGNATLELARDLILTSLGPVHELVIVVPPGGESHPPEVIAAADAFESHLAATSGALVLLDERPFDDPAAEEGRRYIARLGEREPTIITVLHDRSGIRLLLDAEHANADGIPLGAG